jgi:hypothetical protein
MISLVRYGPKAIWLWASSIPGKRGAGRKVTPWCSGLCAAPFESCRPATRLPASRSLETRSRWRAEIGRITAKLAAGWSDLSQAPGKLSRVGAASSLLTPSLTAFGAASTRSLAGPIACFVRQTRREPPSTCSVSPFTKPFAMRKTTAAPASSAVPRRRCGSFSVSAAT